MLFCIKIYESIIARDEKPKKYLILVCHKEILYHENGIIEEIENHNFKMLYSENTVEIYI